MSYQVTQPVSFRCMSFVYMAAQGYKPKTPQMRTFCTILSVRWRHRPNVCSWYGSCITVITQQPPFWTTHSLDVLYSVYALYDRNKVIAAILSIYLVAEFGVAMWIYITPGGHRTSSWPNKFVLVLKNDSFQHLFFLRAFKRSSLFIVSNVLKPCTIPHIAKSPVSRKCVYLKRLTNCKRVPLGPLTQFLTLFQGKLEICYVSVHADYLRY